MKINQLMAVCGIAAALFIGVGDVSAQNNGGGGNFDRAQFQQRMMERFQTELGITNDTDWSAIEPLVQKVQEAQRATRPDMGRMFGRNRGGQGGPGGRRGMFGAAPNPAADALQKAVDDNAPTDQIKDLLAKYQASQKERQEKLAEAQKNLRAVLSVKQEAQATLMGLLD